MKQSFEKPMFDIIRFNRDVITSSGCSCDIGGYDFGGCNQNVCTTINTYCDCQTNTVDETKANCIKT